MDEVLVDAAAAATVAEVAPTDPDEWRKRPGTPVLSTGGDSGVLVAYDSGAASDGETLSPCEVRFGAARGSNSRTERFRAEDMVRPLAAAVGFAVRTPKGRGVVLRVHLAASEGAEDRYEVELTPSVSPVKPPSSAAAKVASAEGEEGLEDGYKAPSAEAVLAEAVSSADPGDEDALAKTPLTEDTAAVAVVETFNASEVSCTGAVVLPVVEALTGQVRLA